MYPVNLSGGFDLQGRVRQKLQTDRCDDRLFTLFKERFEHVLSEQGIILSRAEKQRLLRAVMKDVLIEMAQKL